MRVVQVDYFLVRETGIIPPGFNLNLMRKEKLSVFINGSLRDFIDDPNHFGLVVSFRITV